MTGNVPGRDVSHSEAPSCSCACSPYHQRQTRIVVVGYFAIDFVNYGSNKTDYDFIVFAFLFQNVAQFGGAFALGAKGREFESRHSDHIQGRALTISLRHSEPECYLALTEGTRR